MQLGKGQLSQVRDFKGIEKKIDKNSINPIVGFDCKDMKYTIIIDRSVMFSVQSTQFSSVHSGAVQCWID